MKDLYKDRSNKLLTSMIKIYIEFPEAYIVPMVNPIPGHYTSLSC